MSNEEKKERNGQWEKFKFVDKSFTQTIEHERQGRRRRKARKN